MKTTISQNNSSILVPNVGADQAANAMTPKAQPGPTPRVHIIDRRAARWARRRAH